MSLNLNVNSNILGLLAAVATASLFGKTNVRVLSETLGKPAEVNRLVRLAARDGLVTTEDSVYTRTFKRGNRTITEEIPTKSVTLTTAGSQLNALITALNEGNDAGAASILRVMVAAAAASASEEASEEAAEVAEPKAKKAKARKAA